ncbi:MAG: rRNA maturation RNase YbeY [Lachnospiraceae bacterium]
MTFYAENNTDRSFDFPMEEVFRKVAGEVLRTEKADFEAEVNLMIVDLDTIHEMNRDYRQIDRPTDVLSFPNLSFDSPGKFDLTESADVVDPETGEVVLGDIVICYDKVLEQAEEYGHSILREFAFLLTHSMLHLCGYDHMTEEETSVMEAKQNQILDTLKITRD